MGGGGLPHLKFSLIMLIMPLYHCTLLTWRFWLKLERKNYYGYFFCFKLVCWEIIRYQMRMNQKASWLKLTEKIIWYQIRSQELRWDHMRSDEIWSDDIGWNKIGSGETKFHQLIFDRIICHETRTYEIKYDWID